MVMTRFYVWGRKTTYGPDHLWMLEVDGEGVVMGQKVYHSDGVQYPSEVREIPGGGVLVAGITNGFGAEGYDGWVVRLGPKGQLNPDCGHVSQEGVFEIPSELSFEDVPIEEQTLPSEVVVEIHDGAFQAVRTPACLPNPCSITCSPETDTSEGVMPLWVQFSSNLTSEACLEEPLFEWDFGDWYKSDERNPLHIYDEPGEFTWSVEITQDGRVCSATGTVVVSPEPPGDCNFDGIITIGEVQRAINMFLGVESPSCLVDGDEDGTVSIGELQSVINAFLS